jgi:hypothetical protein
MISLDNVDDPVKRHPLYVWGTPHAGILLCMYGEHPCWNAVFLFIVPFCFLYQLQKVGFNNFRIRNK